MIKKWNERITITLPKNQMKWLKKTAKSRHIRVSTLVKEALSSYRFTNIINDEDSEFWALSEEAKQEMCRIAKTPWLDDEDF